MGDGYVAIENGEAFLYNVNIAQYSFGNRFNHQAKQKRRLLLHKREILKLHQQVTVRVLDIDTDRQRISLQLIKQDAGRRTS